MKKIKVLHGKLLVKRDKPEEKVGTIFIPQTANQKIIGEGTVIKGNTDLPAQTQIYFNKYAGTDVDLGDKEEYVVLDPRDILAIREG